MSAHCVKFSHGLLKLVSLPAFNCVVLSPDVVGYFVIGRGEGIVDDVISSSVVRKYLVPGSPILVHSILVTFSQSTC